jgi:hypothetical protein
LFRVHGINALPSSALASAARPIFVGGGDKISVAHERHDAKRAGVTGKRPERPETATLDPVVVNQDVIHDSQEDQVARRALRDDNR